VAARRPVSTEPTAADAGCAVVARLEVPSA